eukprot:scaffold5441_cov63-Cylindrotheca_fusiformis.AAC.2
MEMFVSHMNNKFDVLCRSTSRICEPIDCVASSHATTWNTKARRASQEHYSRSRSKMNEHTDDFTHDGNRCNRRTWKPQPWNPAMLMVVNSTVASTDTNSEGEPVGKMCLNSILMQRRWELTTDSACIPHHVNDFEEKSGYMGIRRRTRNGCLYGYHSGMEMV